MLKPKENSLF